MQEKMEKVPCLPKDFIAPSSSAVNEATGTKFSMLLREREEAFEEIRRKSFGIFQEKRATAGLSNGIDTSLNKGEPVRLESCADWKQYIVDSIESTILKGLDLNALRDHRPKAAHNPQVPKYTTIPVTKEAKFFDKNGELALLVVRKGQDETYRGVPGYQPMNDRMIAVDKAFEDLHPAQQPPKGSRDSRHPLDDYHQAEKQYYESLGRGCGRQHFGAWMPRGHENDRFYEPQIRWNHIRTSDSKGGESSNAEIRAMRVKAAEQYRRDILPLEISICSTYKAADPVLYQRARSHFSHMVANGICDEYSVLQCHLLVARVVNRTVGNHTDSGDAKKMMASWTPVGKYDGGDICFPSLNIRIALLPGDEILAHASLIPHCVAPIVGFRTALVFTSKSDATTIKENVAQMSPGPELTTVLEAREALRNKKTLAHMARQRIELALMQEYIAAMSIEDIAADCDAEFPRNAIVHDQKLCWVPRQPQKLEKAVREKNRALRANGSAPQAVLDGLKKRPASLFYEFNKPEMKRVEQGKAPFDWRVTRKT